jgi:hypothetical protein
MNERWAAITAAFALLAVIAPGGLAIAAMLPYEALYPPTLR